MYAPIYYLLAFAQGLVRAMSRLFSQLFSSSILPIYQRGERETKNPFDKKTEIKP